MAQIDHDYIDKIWDDLSNFERKYCEGLLVWVILNPRILKDWAGVDILNGKIKRTDGNSEVWEDYPQLKTDYKRLHDYVKVVIEKDDILRDMLQGYG